ncbi:MAG: GMC oxidoreductase [Pseudonocardiaceae bacterium]
MKLPSSTSSGSEKCARSRPQSPSRFVAVAGYSIETPRLLLASISRRFPEGLCNDHDQVGRYVMVRGASPTAGRWPEELRMYKAPPPEVSSEQFYETDRSRGFARGFSIQTVAPLPIGWAEHVLADGHWGRALREYMRDYNHWGVIGVLNELLPHPDNRITLADETDRYGQPVARMDYTLSDNDQANVAYSTKVITDILHAGDAQDVLTIHRYAHLIGGARMGSSPEVSVVDAHQRAWAVPNLFLSDGSVCPTQGSANPALTIMALASRLAAGMAGGAAMDDDPAVRAGRIPSVVRSAGRRTTPVRVGQLPGS